VRKARILSVFDFDFNFLLVPVDGFFLMGLRLIVGNEANEDCIVRVNVNAAVRVETNVTIGL
jgi:hypothetical protein